MDKAMTRLQRGYLAEEETKLKWMKQESEDLLDRVDTFFHKQEKLLREIEWFTKGSCFTSSFYQAWAQNKEDKSKFLVRSTQKQEAMDKQLRKTIKEMDAIDEQSDRKRLTSW